MKIKYLGTAAAEGIPALFCYCKSCEEARRLGGKSIRTRSQAIIDDALLIDFPADTYLHVLYGGLELHKVRHCLITHAHCDHLYPDEISMRHKNFAKIPAKEEGALCFYGSRAVKKKVGGIIYDYDLEQQDRAAFRHVLPFQTYDVGGYAVTPLLATHDPMAEPYIYVIAKDGKTMLYGNDTGLFPEKTWDYLAKSGIRFDFVSLDCTEGDGPIGYDSHMNLERDLLVRERLCAMGCADEKTVFCANHFSHNGGNVTYGVFAERAKEKGFLTSYDGMTVEF